MPKNKLPTEAWVYDRNGQATFFRDGTNIYQGGRRVAYISRGTIYDERGVERWYISDRDRVWWHDVADGTPVYYQEHEVTGDED